MKTTKSFLIELFQDDRRYHLGEIVAVSEAQARQLYQWMTGCSNKERDELIVTLIGERPELMKTEETEVYLSLTGETLGDIRRRLDALIDRWGAGAVYDEKVRGTFSYPETYGFVQIKRPPSLAELRRINRPKPQ